MPTLVERWMEIDRASATTRIDVEAIQATAAPREAIARFAALDPSSRDLLHAAGMLGRLLAAANASPTLAAVTMDGLARAIEGRHDFIPSARAALLEAYVAEREERAHDRGLERWSYPGCAVHLDAETCAIAAGVPDDDDDRLVAWADSVARALARVKVRKAVVSGSDRARSALEDALGLVGIRAERAFVVR
jgi:hypothetical protein